MKADVKAFFDEATNTVSYIVRDPSTNICAIIDPVLDFDQKSGRTSTKSADKIAGHVEAHGLGVAWILETHAHADHLTAAPYLQQLLGGKIAIGEHIGDVQKVFQKTFNLDPDFPVDGAQFDHLFEDGDEFLVGKLKGRVMHTPGHTPACVTYIIEDAAFVGDTLFMPDYGTARCDFPGGNARTLYRSIRRLLTELPGDMRLFLCHDYKAPGREDYAWETTVAEQRAQNIHVHDGVGEEDFVTMREARDKTLSMPQLILPSIQVNIRAGHFPDVEDNGVSYLKLPLNQF